MDNANSLRAARDRRIAELRSLGWTHQAIADDIGCSRQTVTKVLNPHVRERDDEYHRVNAGQIKAQQYGYRLRNQDRIRQQTLEYRRANVARKAAYDREYRRANAEGLAAYQAEYRMSNLGLIREKQRRYREENRERRLHNRRTAWAMQAAMLNARRRARYDDTARQRAAEYRRAHIEAHRAVHARRRMRAWRGMDAVDRVLSVEYRKAIANDPCTYCGRPGEQDDHRLPLARGGTDHWWNLHRACTNCNQRKHTMTHEEFVTSGRVPIVA